MNYDEALNTLLSSAGLVLCLSLMIWEWRTKKQLVSTWLLFLAMCSIDIFLVGILVPWIGIRNASFVDPSRVTESLSQAIIAFLFSIVMFRIGYVVVQRDAREPSIRNQTTYPLFQKRKLSIRRVWLLLLIALLIYMYKISWDVSLHGSVSDFMRVRLTNRFVAAPINATGISALLLQLANKTRTLIFMLIGILYANRNGAITRRAIIPITIGILICFTTFLRGTLLSLFLGLLIIEGDVPEGFKRLISSSRANLNRRRLWVRLGLFMALAIGLFVGYGTVRNYLTGQQREVEITVSGAYQFELQRLVRGEGLVGFSSILSYYPDEIEFFHGKTFYDMILLPIPRSVYKSKPPWYGISDITRSMGWPKSTQNAVSMPGELYANFGWFGVLGMVFYGMFFGLFERTRQHPRWYYIYAFVIVPLIIPTFWMGFTGFISGLTQLTFTVVALLLVFPRRQVRYVSFGTQLDMIAKSSR